MVSIYFWTSIFQLAVCLWFRPLTIVMLLFRSITWWPTWRFLAFNSIYKPEYLVWRLRSIEKTPYNNVTTMYFKFSSSKNSPNRMQPFTEVTMHWGKEELKLALDWQTLANPRCHHGPLVNMWSSGGQIMNGVLCLSSGHSRSKDQYCSYFLTCWIYNWITIYPRLSSYYKLKI